MPLKKNKFDRRFGFTRFRNVEDIRMFAVKLDNISIDNKNTFANVPRFERKGGDLKECSIDNKSSQDNPKSLGETRSHKGGDMSSKDGRGNWVGNISFAEVVGKKEFDFVNVNRQPVALLEFCSEEEEVERYKRHT